MAVFAIFHGAAHGAGMPAAASGLAYGTGMILSSLALYLFGMTLGAGLQRARGELLRLAGAAIALAGGIFYLAGRAGRVTGGDGGVPNKGTPRDESARTDGTDGTTKQSFGSRLRRSLLNA